MQSVSRLPRISITASMLLALTASIAFGQAKADDTARTKEARELAEAIKACDEGAAVPLDYAAKVPPVNFGALRFHDDSYNYLKALQASCQEAWIGAPKEKRMHLQWIRVTLALPDANAKLLTPQIRQLAAEGSAEAQYLLYRLRMFRPDDGPSSALDVSRDEAWTNLNKAAEAGLLDAVRDMTVIYHGTLYAKRDLRQVVKWARRLEGMPPQGISNTRYEDEARASGRWIAARATLDEDGFPATEQRMAFRLMEERMKAGGKDAGRSAYVVIKSLRAGRGVRKDPGRAREMLEARVREDKYAVGPLADMLVKGEGGPEDGKRAYAMLRAADLKDNPTATDVLAEILLAGRVAGRRTQEAILLLAGSASEESPIRLAGLLSEYHNAIEKAELLKGRLERMAGEGNAEAALAFAKLKLSGNSQFSDEDGARLLLRPLADAGNREALWLYASTQYRNLGSTSFRPMPREDGLRDAELMAIIDDGIRREEPEAFLLKAKLLRVGLLYPQDDRAASDMLKQAARGDNIEALLLLGDAYDDGLGIGKDKKRRIDAWRRAAELGSIRAKSKIARAFTFDTFDRLMTLEEGVTWRIALYNDGYGRTWDGMGLGDSAAEMEFMGLFMGRAMEGGTDAVAEAVMNGFREAPAGLDDKNLVAMGKAFPPEIKVAIESRLARDGFYRGSPDGYWGPDVRKALADWVEAKGYIPPLGVAKEEGQSSDAQEASTEASSDLLENALIDRIRTEATREANAAKSNRQKRAALEKVNLLAQYGDTAARWALVPNYHQVEAVRRVVSAAEITRYGLDMMITRPPGAEKVDFEVIFNVTQIYQDGKASEFGKSVLDTIRDDERLHDPLVLGGVLKQFLFAPGACDAVLASANRAGVDGMGPDGCDDTSLGALVSFAKAKGPAGIDERNKKAAAEALKSL